MTRNAFRFLALPLVLTLYACQTAPRNGAAANAARTSSIARPLEVYQQLGFMAGPADFPVVASIGTLAGPRDSTYVLVGLSLPNSALRFQRDSTGFVGKYHISISFLRDTVVVKRVDRTESVHVTSFAETARTDESVIFQDMTALAPGKYNVQVTSTDAFSARGFRGRDSVDVPAYDHDVKLSTPVLVYEATGRATPESRPDFIVNARKTVPYGADMPRVYIELYGASVPQDVELRVVDEKGSALWQQHTSIGEGDSRLRHALIDIPSAPLPLGRLWLEASTGSASELIRTPLLVTISDQWLVANFDEVLRFVNYIALPAEMDSLRSASGAEQRDRWDRFWARRDPLPATPLNEYREEFFNRVRFAADHFAETGKAGWDTRRGEVYIVLGPPTEVVARQIGRDSGIRPNALEWFYENAAGGGRLQLHFIDRRGFGEYDLAPESESSFRSAAQRLRPRQGAFPGNH